MKTKEQMHFDITDLNEGQQKAFEQLKVFMAKRDDTMCIVAGFAGTGKTFLIKRFIKYLHIKYPGFRVAVTGPTNKSVKVLAKSSGMKDVRVNYQTVHKLLGLKEEIQNDGKIKFTKSFSDKNEIDQYKVLIIDEVSMLDDELFIEIQANSRKLKIIFMGDPAQIPPVNRPDCIPFNSEKNIYYNFINCSLSEIMRQSQDNPIIKASFGIRNNLTKHYPIDEVYTTVNEKGNGIIRIDANKDSDRMETMKLFEKYFKCKEFNDDPDHAKVIAWRNKTIDKTNNIIRSILYGKEPGKIMIGEKLVCNKPIMDGLNIIIFNTNDELSVEEFNVASDIFVSSAGKNRLNYYDTTVLSFDVEGKEIRRRIKILHESSQNEFNAIANSLKSFAIEQKGAHRSWPKYYEFLRMFAEVGYNYSITAHKSQGSTYKNVFVLEDDIISNTDIKTRNRILYTVYSRASEKLFVIKR